MSKRSLMPKAAEALAVLIEKIHSHQTSLER